MFDRFEYLEIIASTNDYLKAFTGDGRPRAVRAGEQTAGKGRSGKSWLSEPGLGLYVSYLVFPDWLAGQAPYFNQIASLAVLESIRRCGGSGLDLRIKEPNDIYIAKRKVCGLLTELSTFRERIQWAIVGAGVNLAHQSFPPALQDKATSLHLEGLAVDAARLCSHLTERFEHHYRLVSEGSGKAVARRYAAEKKLEAGD
ncbi:MAG: biotin--[acetyl-CoA-carboxylase] ligase [Acidobacteriota bacterium]